MLGIAFPTEIGGVGLPEDPFVARLLVRLIDDESRPFAFAPLQPLDRVGQGTICLFVG